ncbi:hypothetical protein AX14_005373 [Amanita brunnescens Koide BX004]|nr:hypothetical protein AX14_005373 [Amanita brunnescens Koide BX004]
MSPLLKAVPAFLAVWFLITVPRKLVSVRNAMRDLGDVPGKAIIWLHPFGTAALLAAPWFPRPGTVGYYSGRFSLFKKYGSTCLSSVLFWSSTPVYFVADADAFRSLNNERRLFEKVIDAYEPLNVYGKNIVSTTGSEWKKHRAVAKNAFNEANNAYVWSETCRIVNQWFSTFRSKSEAPVECLRVFKQIAFLVIASAGFGAKMDYNDTLNLNDTPVIDNEFTTPGSTKPIYVFGSSLTTASHRFHVRAVTPSFIYPIAKYIRIPFISTVLEETTISFESLKLHMEDIISHSRDALFRDHAKNLTDASKNNDVGSALLTTLVQSNMNEESRSNLLTDDEIISDTFVFLLAGHETTANTLSFALCLLALYPEVQANAYAEVCCLWPEAPPSLDVPPVYKDCMPRLEYVTAAFHETLRLFSSVPRLAKVVLSDTVIKTRRFTMKADGTLDKVEVVNTPIKAGSAVILDIHGLHHNPIHWGEDVDKFMPERFIDTETYKWPRDAFAGFSQGQRSCIGQRFAVTEAACVLANLIRRYEILLPTYLESKPRVEQEKELLEWTPSVTILPTNTRVRLRKRIFKAD